MNYRPFATFAFVNWNIRQFLSTGNVSILCVKTIKKCPSGERRVLLSKRKLTSSSTPTSLGMIAGKDLSSSMPSVCLASSENAAFQDILENISDRYSIPTLPPDSDHISSSSFSHCIHMIPYEFKSMKSYAIGIQPIETSSESNPRRQRRKRTNAKKGNTMRPVYIDFFPSSSSSLGNRSRNADGEMLLKAVSPSKYAGDNPLGGAVVYDLCAGFGQDSILLASSMKVVQVHMVERDPIVGLLLEDALRRLDLIANMHDCQDADSEKARLLLEKINLNLQDSVSFCNKKLMDLESAESLAARPDVCYLDPMFPPRTKSAAVKKNMQVLHGLFQTNEKSLQGDERDSQEKDLLQSALSLSKSRVVVKRPINAPPLGYRRDEKGLYLCSDEVRPPSFELKGSINRFDVYMVS